MFFDLFILSFTGIAKILIIGVLGAALLGGSGVRQSFLDALSALFLRITLPCLIFTNMATQFRPDEVDQWWIFPLLGIGLFSLGGLLAYAYVRFDKKIISKEIFISSVAFHNSIVLPLAIAPALFGPEKLTRFYSLLFLYNLLAVPAFFTVGVWLMNSTKGVRFSLKHFINPPIIATVSGIVVASTGLYAYLPDVLMDPLQMFGSLTTPLSMIIVGGIILASIPGTRGDDWADPIKIMILKSLVMPTLACVVMFIFRPPEYIALFLFLGAAMPAGSTLAVICPADKTMQKLVAGGILLTSIASVFAVSVLMSAYNMIYSQ